MTETSTTTAAPFGIACNDLSVGQAILFPHLGRSGCELRKHQVSGIIEYPATRVLYFEDATTTPGVADRTVVLQVPCSWGLHDEPAIGRTRAGIAICATCLPLSGLAMVSR